MNRICPLLLACLLGFAPGSQGWSFPSPQLHPSQTTATPSTAKDATATATTTTTTPSSLSTRRDLLGSMVGSALSFHWNKRSAWADEASIATDSLLNGDITTQVSGDVKKFFNEARALESQGNIAAAQRLYSRVTQIQPRFIYGWSQLGNTQTAFGDLNSALQSYTTAIDLCTENNRRIDEAVPAGGGRKCNDLYVMYLNRGSIRLNSGEPQLALVDLSKASALRGRPDAVILQNLARAKEVNGQYASADRDYTTAIMMTSNEVSPFWLRSAMVKFQVGDEKSAMDLLKRVELKFPEAPEVRAAYAVLLSAKGDTVAGQQKYLEIPDRARSKFVDENYLTQTIAWPPTMREQLAKISQAVGDIKR